MALWSQWGNQGRLICMEPFRTKRWRWLEAGGAFPFKHTLLAHFVTPSSLARTASKNGRFLLPYSQTGGKRIPEGRETGHPWGL